LPFPKHVIAQVLANATDPDCSELHYMTLVGTVLRQVIEDVVTGRGGLAFEGLRMLALDVADRLEMLLAEEALEEEAEAQS